MLSYGHMITYAPEVLQAIIVSQKNYVWEAPTAEKYQRGARWYLFMALGAMFFVAYAVWTGNFIFAFLILLMGIILLLAGNEEPARALVQIGDLGVVWNGKYHAFGEFENFAIVYQPPSTKVLYLERKGLMTMRYRIHLEDQNPTEIRAYLKQYIVEDTALQDEHLSDILGRLLRI